MSTQPQLQANLAGLTISDVLAGYRGVYARVAERLGVDASYISRIADGSRTNEAIHRALIEEIQTLNASTQQFLLSLMEPASKE